MLQPIRVRRPAVLVRRAVRQDAIAIWRVIQEAVTTLIGHPYTRAQIDAWIEDEHPAKISRYIELGRTAFVAESNRRIIGFSLLSGTEIEALYVHPAHSGRKVGDRLLSTMEESASVRRVETLYLDAALNAVRFYESRGYRALGPSLPIFDNGVALPCVRMCRRRNHLTAASSSAGSAFSRKMLYSVARLMPNARAV
jgi:putative acetyltransferase